MNQNSQTLLALNTLSEEQLVEFFNLSPRLAKRIIAMRPYSSFEQIDQIWGLDLVTKQKILEYPQLSKPKLYIPGLPKTKRLVSFVTEKTKKIPGLANIKTTRSEKSVQKDISFKSKSIVLKIIAIVIGIIAQVIIDKYLFLSIAFLLAALVLFFFSIRKESALRIPEIVFNPQAPEKISRWCYILGGVSIALTIFSFYLFSTKIPNLVAWIFHGISIFLAILSITLFAWETKKKPVRDTWHWLEIVALIVVFLIAISIRIYKISQLPYGFWFDEADNGLNALELFNGTTNFPVFASSTHLPTHLLYLIALSIKIFGQSIFSVRIVSVLFGVGTVAAAFLVGRELFDRRMGIILAFFLSISRWDLVWSRIGMHGVTVPFFELFTIGLLLRAFRLQRYRDYFFTGLSLGLGFCFYVPFRLFPAVILVLLIGAWLTNPNFLRNTYRHLLVFILGAIVISVPISQFAVFHSEDFWGRTNQVSIFNDRTIREGLQTALKTTGEHLAMFTYKGDKNGRHNIPSEPMLDPITGALFVLGIGICLYRIKRPVSILMLSWLLVMLIPGIFSLDFESPQSLRAIGSLPAVYLLAILPFYELVKYNHSLPSKMLKIAVNIFVFTTLVVVGFLNVNLYFNNQMRSTASWLGYSTKETIIAKKINELGNKKNYYISIFYNNSPTIRFLAPDVNQTIGLETYDVFPLFQENDRDLVFFIDPDQKMFFELAEKYFPNGKYEEIYEPNGHIILYGIYLTADDLKSNQGLMATYYPEGKSGSAASFSQKETEFAFDWQNHIPLSPPYLVKWEGVLFAHLFGEYRFFSNDPGHTQLVIDGQTVQWSSLTESNTGITLAKGNHAISIQAEVGNGSFALDWQPPNEDLKPLTSASLFVAPVTMNGLLGEYYAGLDWSEPVQYAQIDPSISFYYHNQPLPRPYTVEWKGRIKIEEPGLYRFALTSIDGSTLYIGEKELINNTSPGKKQQEEMFLDIGYYPIRVLYTDQTGYTQISLFWTPPGKEESIIPPEVLFYP
ncbi:MAG: hypothetical protein CVU39_21100 [Chloroflexi bacterium HGW-Chloroflexi-10]|nr:MAG: hypothetical protein CVU39_21100 [Chloroflexi bacterium HGW-Chloroflexi-10]